TSTVTVVGEVQNSLRMPLSAQGQRVLDAIAAAGGIRQPLHKTTLQLSRGEQTRSMSLQAVIRDPRQNVLMQPGDVLTALHQSQSYTVLGATGRNEEIPFESTGITLAQALARAGGLQDNRAHALGVFLFRFESPNTVPWTRDAVQPKPAPGAATQSTEARSPTIKVPAVPVMTRVPVVYQTNLAEPGGYFLAKEFEIRDGDLIFVSNAPAAELEKFLRLISTVVTPVIWANTLTQ
ncbi:MAG: SLBB domain-containing protein, partial [Burkholderiaceae bacterium]